MKNDKSEPINLILQTLETQLNQRLEKLWRVFSWCSSIFISLTAGVIAASNSEDFNLEGSDRILISAVIIILTIYGRGWIKENLKFEESIRDQIDEIFKEKFKYPPITEHRPDKAQFGYEKVLLWLGLVALTATWEPLFFRIIYSVMCEILMH